MEIRKRTRYLFGDGESGRKLQTRGEGGTNAHQTREEVIATVGRWNQEGRLFNNYTDSRQSTLLRFDLDDQSRVAITNPINPYTPETLMITAFEKRTPRTELTAQYIYTKSEQLQYKYWQATLAQMIALERQTPLEETHLAPFRDDIQQMYRRYIKHETSPERYVFFMENTGPLSLIDDRFRRADLGGYSPRTARTGAEIHLHVAAIEDSWLKQGARRMPEIVKERQVLRHMIEDGRGEDFVTHLSQLMLNELRDPAMQQRFLKHVRFVLEEGTPVGYSLRFDDVNMKNALANVSYFSDVMRAHFLAYSKTQRKLFGDLVDNPTLTPQPSFRTYGTFEKGKSDKSRTLTITISPQINSFHGPLEAAGVELQRSPDFPALGNERQTKAYRERLLRTTRRLTRSDRTHETRRVKKFSQPELP